MNCSKKTQFFFQLLRIAKNNPRSKFHFAFTQTKSKKEEDKQKQGFYFLFLFAVAESSFRRTLSNMNVLNAEMGFKKDLHTFFSTL